ncbi:hypothetical protein B0H21DRAFT_714760 [Amylocystis lapponica]|nr:hypothetical protein B0H21DRAFT_714760 [Amylocystis lapponica]
MQFIWLMAKQRLRTVLQALSTTTTCHGPLAFVCARDNESLSRSLTMLQAPKPTLKMSRCHLAMESHYRTMTLSQIPALASLNSSSVLKSPSGGRRARVQELVLLLH